jgi:GR25 family glycosyltransferase involved in LPS biosynthesis
MNIFNFPLYYISFKRNIQLEKKCEMLGFTNVNHLHAVNGRKFNAKELLNKNLITIRAYNDLITGRHEDSGIPSLGAIGCTMSHDLLWRKCVKEDFPYMIVLEGDVKLPGKIEKETENIIKKILSKDNSVYISANKFSNKNDHVEIFGTHFYIISLGACKELIKNTFPIDVQTDAYMSSKMNEHKIIIENFTIAGQGNIFEGFNTTIQDFCVKCYLPKNVFFYIILLVIFLIILFLFMRYYKKFKKCKKSCKKCK